MTEETNQEQLPENSTEKTTDETPPEDNLMESLEEEVEAEETAKPTEKLAPVKAKKKEDEEEIVEEKTYTIPLSKARIMTPRKRSPRAMRMLRAFIIKHMKIPSRAEEEDEEPPSLTIKQEVNEYVWGRGIEKPPRKVRVRATKDKEGNVTVHLAEGE